MLDLAGEAYQAFFDSQAAALEALNAAGVGNKPMPLQQAAEVCSTLYFFSWAAARCARDCPGLACHDGWFGS